MPQYFFSIRAGDDGTPAERAVELCDDAAALAHACEIVRELMLGLTHADRSSLVKVRASALEGVRCRNTFSQSEQETMVRQQNAPPSCVTMRRHSPMHVRSFESSCKASPTLIGVRW